MADDYASNVIDQEPGMTEFEQPTGDRLLHEHMETQNLEDLDVWEQAFDRLILPAAIAPITRAGYYSQWRSLVTFAYIMNAMDELLPMSERLIKAFILQAVLIGYSVGTITGYVAAIKHRHKIRKIDFTIGTGDLRTWCQALHKNRGMPSTPKFKILPAHLKMAMQIPWTTLARLRDICIFTIGTVCAMRASEVTQLDICDLSWNHDGPETLMLRIKHRKNGMAREGLFPRIGASNHKRFNVLQMLRMYLRWANLTVQTRMHKEIAPDGRMRSVRQIIPADAPRRKTSAEPGRHKDARDIGGAENARPDRRGRHRLLRNQHAQGRGFGSRDRGHSARSANHANGTQIQRVGTLLRPRRQEGAVPILLGVWVLKRYRPRKEEGETGNEVRTI